MNKLTSMELTAGSAYKIISLGGKDHKLETEGVFKGFASIGSEEFALIMELNHKHGEMAGKIRILPIPVILAIDVLEAIPDEKKDDSKEMSHYVG